MPTSKQVGPNLVASKTPTAMSENHGKQPGTKKPQKRGGWKVQKDRKFKADQALQAASQVQDQSVAAEEEEEAAYEMGG